MASITSNLFEKIDLRFFSEILPEQENTEKLYREVLQENNQTTRSDSKINCHNFITLILLWVLHPEQGYKSILNKCKLLLLSYSTDLLQVIGSITDAGLSKARKRFSSFILKKIWQSHVIVNYFKEHGVNLWNGMQVCAIDGVYLTLNNAVKILKDFPARAGEKLPKMLACVLYDVHSRVPLDIAFGNYHSDERGLLLKLIEKIGKNTLLLLDRGYPAVGLLHKLLLLNVHFIIRLPKTFNCKIIRKLANNDWIVEIYFNKICKNNLQKYLSENEYRSRPEKIILRLVKVQIKGFQPRFLITSLLDNSWFLIYSRITSSFLPTVST